ncbi:MAG TPA: phenylalanine--tRNA ligase subunit alpha [Proteobacteria bacterium]|nr:phenylalanine--tRNA ligase alpha subunit [bacterium BMS3Abin14]HDL52577.1 phenylalanine--tRNA ligase subunit alpha [Pseudomonadota bacterium]
MKAKVDKLLEEVQKEISSAESLKELNEIKVRFLGKKGWLTALLKSLGELPPDERPEAGQAVNNARKSMVMALDQRAGSIAAAERDRNSEEQKADITMPGVLRRQGYRHPISLVMEEALSIFQGLGFSIRQGPEIEKDYYNFEALNIPRDHPARDMQDTFYIDTDTVLRTHTSPVQIRTMESEPPPMRIVSPGKVYRVDFDVTHSPMFHQVEGFMVDEGVSFSDLKGVLTQFVLQIFGESTAVRFRPSFFPFTEPSAEVDIGCVICGGTGCRVCSGTGWLEILGSGMIHPEVFRSVNYDSEKYSGFAFGVGIERIAMLRYRIDDIRLFFENDTRFLSQFG